MQSSRAPTRKACDLCYRRKIKCDGTRPRCSHCILHDSDCTFTAVKRTARPRTQLPARQIALQEQVHRLEAQVAAMLKQPGGEQARSDTDASTTIDDTQSLSSAGSSTRTDQDVSSLASESMPIPPRDEVLHAVKTFAETFNWSLPLFHVPALIRMIKTWYSTPHQRTPTTWAAINVVLALAAQHGSDQNRAIASEYLSRAQSAMTSIIMDPQPELLNVQVILGMVAVFQGARDLQPALVLIATAMRLVHRLGLHSRRSMMAADPAAAEQCRRVFWVAYVLDKDLSLRTMVPSIQRDEDVDLDLPSEYLISDSIESASALSDVVRENYFSARVQLARIEGLVYDNMLSARSLTWDYDKRASATFALLGELEQWKTDLPAPFKLDNAITTADRGLLRSLGLLHGASITCETHIHVTHAHDRSWLQNLQALARGETVEPAGGWQTPELTDEARKFMILYSSVPNSDGSLRWHAGCAYLTCMLIVLVHIINNPQTPTIEDDQKHVADALEMFEYLVDHDGGESMRPTLEMSKELSNVADWKRLFATGDAGSWEPAVAPGIF